MRRALVALPVLAALLAAGSAAATDAPRPDGAGGAGPASATDAWVDWALHAMDLLEPEERAARVVEAFPGAVPQEPPEAHPQRTLAGAPSAPPSDPFEPVAMPPAPVDHPPFWTDRVGLGGRPQAPAQREGDTPYDPVPQPTRTAGTCGQRASDLLSRLLGGGLPLGTIVMAAAVNPPRCEPAMPASVRASAPGERPRLDVTEDRARSVAGAEDDAAMLPGGSLPRATGSAVDDASHAPAPELARVEAALLLMTPARSPLWWVAAGALLGALPVWALYRRIARSRALEQPTRRTVFELIQAEPGITAGGIARHVGMEHRAATHHLRVLREFRLVEEARVGSWVRYYPSGAHPGSDKALLVALAPPKARAVLRAVADAPAASLAEVARAAGLPKSTARWHLRRLARLGALERGGVPTSSALALARQPVVDSAVAAPS